MVQEMRKDKRLWSIILAGGNGERLRNFTERWMGHHVPKQYCTFVGTRSMLQHTLDRADRLTAPERKVTVIARAHQREAWLQLGERPPGTVILQPSNRETAAGIFLALTYVRARDPEATVVVFPSDHFVYPEDRFVEAVQRAVWAAEWLGNRLVLLGALPERMELEYGWIQAGPELGWTSGHQVRTVEAFLEKPGLAEALAGIAAGALWNTLVFTAKVEALWGLGWRRFPEMMPLFERLGQSVGTSREAGVLESIYKVMPPHNFSSGLLAHATHHLAVLELSGVLWSDWGKPERIAETLRVIGKQPAFPPWLLPAGRPKGGPAPNTALAGENILLADRGADRGIRGGEFSILDLGW